MPTNDHYLIIGNGPAGNHAAFTLREKDPDAAITIISDENISFYSKPKLTRYIAGDIDADDLLEASLESYQEKNIRLRLGQTVEKIEPRKKQVFLKHMESVGYTKLIIASGSRARVLPSMERYADQLFHVTSYNDVIAYKEKIRASQRFFIFGGDLVAFKFVKMLHKMNKSVSLLIYPHAFWPFSLTKQMHGTIVKSLSMDGVELISEDDISAISKTDDAYIVKTVKGLEQEVDMAFSFNGLVPCVEFAHGTGLDIDRGILVNETMQTNLPDIYACGSCAQIYNPKINAYTTSLGWPNAVVQGEVTAVNLLGDHQVIASAGRKYFDLEGVKIKTTWWEDLEESS